MNPTRRNVVWPVAIFLSTAVLQTAEPAKAPVPISPYVAVVYRFADTLIERGFDKQNGRFFSALDRNSITPVTNRSSILRGGSSLLHDENLLRLLYTLTELTTKPKYRDAADAELKWSMQSEQLKQNAAWPWDFNSAKPVFVRPWMLSDRCFELAPNRTGELVFGSLSFTATSLREEGFLFRNWAAAYARMRDDAFLKAIERALAQRDTTSSPPASLVSYAIDCDGAARHVPEPLAARLRALARKQDEAFCSLPHDLTNQGGFLVSRSPSRHSQLWAPGPFPTTAQLAMMCVSRYENTGQTAYRDLIHQAADSYFRNLPNETDAWAATFGQAISLQLAAWRSTAQLKYLQRARELADFAIAKLFEDSPLPRASLNSAHYENTTGSDTLALALLELHLQVLHITAARAPANTIDR